MGAHKLLNNFTGGEITPLLDARIDLAKYDSSCRTLENMRPMVHGGATFRAGTLFLGAAKFGAKACRLIPFNYSTTLTYVLELGDLYMRFYQGNGARVAVTTGTAPFWIRTQAYNPGDFAQWQGIVYLNTVAVAGQIPPAGNNSPDADPGHWTAQTAYEIATPYTEAEVFQVQFREINAIMYLVHPNHAPRKLTRVSATVFTLAVVAWKYPPLTDENVDAASTMTLGATTGATTLTSSVAVFNAAMADAYFEVRHLRDSVTDKLDISQAAGGPYVGTVIEVIGDWVLTTTERWNGTLQLLRSIDGGATYTVARELKAASDQNFSISGTEAAPAIGQPRVKLKLSYTPAGDPYGTPPWVGTVPTSYVKANAILQIADAYIAGLVKCTGYVSPTVMNVTVLLTAWSTAATSLWSESEFDGSRGYPRTVGLYEQRVFFGGTATRLNTVWGSVAADFENFRYSDLDDGAVAYQPAAAQQNALQWMLGLIHLIVGTAGEEMMVGSGNTDEALTPANVTIRTPSSIGSESIGAILVGKAVLFLQRQGKRIREFIEGNPYLPSSWPDPEDVTLFAEHITSPGVAQMDSIRLPDAQVFAVIKDGTIGVMAYDRSQNVKAWARYVTQGNFESVATVYGTPSDVVFVVVKRVINGATVRYVEAFTAEVADKQNGIYGMDAAMTVTMTPGVTVPVGAYLEGATVAVVGDGQMMGDPANGTGLVVTGGNITLPRACTNIRVGLPYYGTLKPMKLDTMLANGTSQGRPRRITELAVRFLNSLGCRYGNANQMYELDFRDTVDALDQSPPLFTGDKPVSFDGSNDLLADIVVEQRQPFPMTVLGLFAEYDVFGN